MIEKISLRDYFAAKAMQAISSNIIQTFGDKESTENVLNRITVCAYGIADAMIQERGDKQTDD